MYDYLFAKILFCVTMRLNLVNTLLTVLFSNYVAAQDVNEDCTLKNGQGTGICTLAVDCESARIAIKNRKPHNLARCGFQGFDEIVCCAVTNNRFGALRKTEQECAKILESSLPPLGLLILGGEVASVGEFPYVVALGYDRGNGLQFDCGGSVISRYYVLTAAHCVETLDGFSPIMVRTGVVDLGSPDWNDETDVRVAERINHPNYTRREKYHDLSLLRLETPLQFSTNLNAVCLETSDSDPTNALTIVGWGQTSNTKAIKSNILLKANVSAVSLAECSKTFNANTYRKLPRGLTIEMLCAGDPTGAHDACQGDSGGPIQVSGAKGQYRVVGVTAFGKGCGSPQPGVYTRISRYLDWIESVVWP